MTIISTFRRIRWIYVFLGILLGIAFWRGIQVLDFPLDDPDTPWQHLVAAHIREYGARPLGDIEYHISPDNPFYYKPPLYYYTLALLGILHNSILFLNVVNLVTQLFFLAVLFALTKRMFTPGVGLVAIVLTIFSGVYLHQQGYIYQPHIMQVALAITWFMLYLYWENGKIRFAYLSLTFLILAISLYLSALIALPIVITILFLSLRKHRSEWTEAANLLGFFIILIAPGWYVSTLFRTAIHSTVIISDTPFILFTKDFILQYRAVLDMVSTQFFPFFPSSPAREVWILGYFILLALVIFYSSVRKKLLFLLISIIAGTVLLAAWKIDVSTRYIIPFLLPITISTAVVIIEISKRISTPLLAFMFIAVWISVSGTVWFEPQSWFRFPQQQSVTTAQRAIHAYIQDTHTDITRISFVKLYKNPNTTLRVESDLTFWNSVETEFNHAILTFGINASSPTYPSDPQTLFLVCSGKSSPYTVPITECFSKHKEIQPEWLFHKIIFTDNNLLIYAFKR